jgi:hypothetical protein
MLFLFCFLLALLSLCAYACAFPDQPSTTKGRVQGRFDVPCAMFHVHVHVRGCSMFGGSIDSHFAILHVRLALLEAFFKNPD